MGKILVLAEKPSVGREIARVMGAGGKQNGYFEGSQYVVTWALGHLVTLADPEHYGEQYKKWDLSTLPMLPDKMELVVIKETSKQYKVVKDLLKRKDIDELVIATDAGREGELVARWIIEKAGFHKPIKRLWISSQTDKAIKEGFAHLHPAKEYERLYQAAVCRAEADWVVGLNVTRALTCKYNAQLSAGRVQTPTLAMIVQREKEIKKFVPKEYYTITAETAGFQLLWRDGQGQTRLFDGERADRLVREISGKAATVTEVKKDLKREAPPLLYDLTELQRDANKRFGFSAKQTLNIMQKLYEEHKLLTYPRTDSRYLSADIVPTLPERLKAISIGDYRPFAAAILKNGVKTNKRIVDDSKVSDHHAIIPTEQRVNLSSLSYEERRVYDLVVKRFLAVFAEPFTYEQTTITAKVGNETLGARGKIVKDKGWKAVYDGIDLDEEEEVEEKEQLLPEVKKGDSLKITKCRKGSGKTKPPARYTEATLLSAMEHPGKFVTDDAVREALDNANGIGTPATRADIIEKLFSAFYVERRGKEIVPTSKGMQLIDLVPEGLKSPELTGQWEQRLTAIAKGKAPSKDFTQEMRQYAASLVGQVVASDAKYTHDNMTRKRCPVCDKFLLEVNGKKGKMLVCQDRECGYRENVSMQSNARCPNCHKKLEIVGSGDKRLYVCKCGFREKYDRFNQQLKDKKQNMNKRETQAYLKKLQQEEPLANNAFAEAWAKAQQQEKE